MPAAYYWLGTVPGGGWSTIGNWTLDPINKTPASTIPFGFNDDVYFDGRVSNVSVSGGSMSGYKSLHLVNGYSGNVGIGGMSVQTFELTSSAATLNKVVSTATLMVTSSFTWTAGTLNATSNLATVTISGSTATGLIAPTGGGTVNLGSNFTLANGAEATITEGTININNDGIVFEVHANCGLIVNPGAGRQVVFGGNATVKNKVWIGGGTAFDVPGFVEVQSGDWDHGGWVVNEGGRYTLKTDTSAYHLPQDQDPYAFDQSAGFVILYPNSKLWAGLDSSVRISGGKLVTVGAYSENTQAIIKVGSSLLITGGEILLGRKPDDFNTHEFYGFATLKVEGEVDWRGGTYRPFLAGEHDEGPSDLWWSTGKFWVGWGANPTPALAPVAINDEHNPMVPTTGYSWLVILSDDEITAPFDWPSYDTNAWELVPDGDETKVWEWWVRAK